MSQVASEALATAHGNARANARHQPARRDPAEAGSTPFAALIDRADAGNDSEAGTRADRFHIANKPAEPPRHTDQNRSTPRAGDRRHTDRTQADRTSADRAPADRQAIRESRDRNNPTGVDQRKDVNSAGNAGARPADDGDAAEETKSTKDSSAASSDDTAATSVDQSGGDAAIPAKNDDAATPATSDKIEILAEAIAAAINPNAAGTSIAKQDAADTSSADKPVLAISADAARPALPEIVSAASGAVEFELSTDGDISQSTDELAAQEAAGGASTAVDTTEAGANPPTGVASDDAVFQAQTTAIDDGGETAPDADTGPADGETKRTVDAGKPHSAAPDNAPAAGKTVDAPPAPANVANGNAAPGAPGHAAHNPIHTPQAHNASPVAVAHAAEASAVVRAQPVPVEGLAVEIAARAHSGKNSFEIRLDPPELGRIEVRLDVDRTGQVTSRLVVDRVDTLDLLRRDAAGLERALQDAGLKTSDNGLQFSLRDQFLDQQAFRESRDTAEVIVRDDTAPVETVHRGYRSLAGARGGVDIRV